MASMRVPNAPPVHLCGRKLETARHTCVFFNGRDEEYAIMAPFTTEGLRQGERVVQIVDKTLVDDHNQRLRRAGVDVDAASAAGQFQVVTSQDAYLSGGEFDPDRTLATVEALVAQRKEAGYPQLRVTGNMEWALSGAPGTERLLEYEARVTMTSAKYHDPFVCFYDVTQFEAPTLIDVMRTHPAVVIGGVFHENPYFTRPEVMLKEIAARRGKDR